MPSNAYKQPGLLRKARRRAYASLLAGSLLFGNVMTGCAHTPRYVELASGAVSAAKPSDAPTAPRRHVPVALPPLPSLAPRLLPLKQRAEELRLGLETATATRSATGDEYVMIDVATAMQLAQHLGGDWPEAFQLIKGLDAIVRAQRAQAGALLNQVAAAEEMAADYKSLYEATRATCEAPSFLEHPTLWGLVGVAAGVAAGAGLKQCVGPQ